MHGSSSEFEIQPDPTTNCGVSCPSETEKLAGNDNMHGSLDEFEIRPDPIGDQRFSCS